MHQAGSFVADKNTEFLREENLKRIEEHLTQVVQIANASKISEQELIEMLHLLME